MSARRGLQAVDSEEMLRADCFRLVAHDINNPLCAIRILAEMLRDEISDHEMRQDMIDILEAADMASALMEGMATLLRHEQQIEDECTWFPLDLVQVLRETVDRPALRRHITLDVPRELQMGGDRNALKRAFTDIFVNARRLSDSRQAVSVALSEGMGTVSVHVRHAAPGIPAGSRERLLDAYGAVMLRQSATPVSAVGLVAAAGIVGDHGGAITFEDAPKGGMDLVVTLSR